MRNSPIIIYSNGELIDPFTEDKNSVKINNKNVSSNIPIQSIARWIKSDNPDVPFIVWFNKMDDSKNVLQLLINYYKDTDIQLGDNLTEYSIVNDSIFGKNIIVW